MQRRERNQDRVKRSFEPTLRLVGVKKLEELLGNGLLGLLLETRLLLGLGADLGSDSSLGVRVEAEENSAVLEGVLALGEGTGGLGGALGTNNGLDLVRVDDAGNVGVGNLGLGQGEARLGGKDLVEAAEGGLGEDDEAAEVSTRGELEEVEAVDRAELDTGHVAEGLDDTGVLVVDDKGTTALGVAAVAQLADTGTDLARVRDLDNVVVGVERLEQGDGLLGLGQVLGGVSNDEGNLLELLDAVTAGEQERGDGGGSQSRGGSVTLLVLVGLDEPSAPQLGGGKHVTTTDHVTKGGLAGAVSTTTADTGDTGNGTTGTPGLGRGLVTSLARDGVGLTLVLGNVGCREWRRRLSVGSAISSLVASRTAIISLHVHADLPACSYNHCISISQHFGVHSILLAPDPTVVTRFRSCDEDPLCLLTLSSKCA